MTGLVDGQSAAVSHLAHGQQLHRYIRRSRKLSDGWQLLRNDSLVIGFDPEREGRTGSPEAVTPVIHPSTERRSMRVWTRSEQSSSRAGARHDGIPVKRVGIVSIVVVVGREQGREACCRAQDEDERRACI